MRLNRGKLAEFILGVAGGTLAIAGVLSLGSGSNLSRLMIILGAVGIVAARYIGRRVKSR